MCSSDLLILGWSCPLATIDLLMTPTFLAPVQAWALNSRFLSSTACFPDPLRCVKSNTFKTKFLFFPSNPAALAVAQVKNYGIILDSSLSLSAFNSSVKAVGFISKIYSQPEQFSSPPSLPLCSITPFFFILDYCSGILTGLPDSIFALLLFIFHSAARAIHLKYKSDLVTSLLSARQWLPISLKIQSYKI